MRIVGRIIARGQNIAGIFIPACEDSLEGIYNVVDIMGELHIRRIGDPAMDRVQFTAIGLDELMDRRPYSMATEQEIAGYLKNVPPLDKQET